MVIKIFLLSFLAQKSLALFSQKLSLLLCQGELEFSLGNQKKPQYSVNLKKDKLFKC